MEIALERMPVGAHVAVIRLRSLGDCILTTPALAILRESRPDLRIAVVVEDQFAPVFEGNPDVDALLRPRARDLRAWGPQLCLNLHGGNRSLALTLLAGARVRAGFGHFRGSFVYHIRIPTAQQVLGVTRKTHTAEQLASAIFYLGAPRREIPRAKLFAQRPAAGPSYAVIHPMARGVGKTWPVERFVAVAGYVAEELGLEPVIIAGSGEDLAAFRRYRTRVGAPLAEVKSLMAGASLFVGNDSGPAHMAAAFALPVVVIFGSSDPQVWAPWHTTSETIIARGPIESVSVDEVLTAIARLKVAA